MHKKSIMYLGLSESIPQVASKDAKALEKALKNLQTKTIERSQIEYFAQSVRTALRCHPTN